MPVLSRILQRVTEAAQQGAAPLVVFDIDSTLLSTSERNYAILKEFADRDGSDPALRDAVAALDPREMGWNIVEDLRHRGVLDEALLEDLKSFWLERFFTDDYLRHDSPIEGAADYVNEVHSAGGLIYYLTGRDAPNMGRGTRQSLAAHGFPLDAPRVELHMKPAFEMSDLDFKREVAAELAPRGVVAAFENEPAYVNLFREAFADADVVMLDTVHSPNPPPLLPGITVIRNFT